MTMTIIDEDGIHTIEEDKNVSCPECYATNEPYRKTCRNCGSLKVKEIVKRTR